MKRILLCGRYGLGKVLKVSDEDYPYLTRTKWNVNKRGYVRGVYDGKNDLLHRHLLYYPDNDIDHKDGDKLNNQRDNLRIVSHTMNMGNQPASKNSKTGVKGVSKFRDKYRVFCGGNYLGIYEDLESAKQAYNIKATEMYGDCAKLHEV